MSLVSPAPGLVSGLLPRLLQVALFSAVFGLIAAACGASEPPERASELLTIVAPSDDTIGGRHVVFTPVDLSGEPAQRIYVHLTQRGTTPVAADPMWGVMTRAGARVIVLAHHPIDSEAAAPGAADIETELHNVLTHIVETAPNDGWNDFIAADDDGVVWERVIIAGHRDGADLAATIANEHPVFRAVYFSGPTNPATADSLAFADDDASRFAFGHRADDHETRDQILTAAGVPLAETIIGSIEQLGEGLTGNRIVSELDLIDGFNERNDWQHRRYAAVWEYLCCE